MSARVTGNSRMVLISNPKSSLSSFYDAITVSSKGLVFFGISLERSSASPIFLDEIYSILKL